MDIYVGGAANMDCDWAIVYGSLIYICNQLEVNWGLAGWEYPHLWILISASHDLLSWNRFPFLVHLEHFWVNRRTQKPRLDLTHYYIHDFLLVNANHQSPLDSRSGAQNLPFKETVEHPMSKEKWILWVFCTMNLPLYDCISFS